MEVTCKNCGETIEFNDSKYCYTHDKSYCVWCSSDRQGNCIDKGEKDCVVDYDYPF